HVYFTLKDENSKVNCFLSGDVFEKSRYEMADGMEITASGYIYLYERGGTYSLNIRDIQIEGLGNLSIAFEKLKDKLEKEGLFSHQYKKEIPFFPHKIAIITSETGAAIQDMLKIITMRNAIVDVLVYPCLVQGPEAAGEISRAIDHVNLLFPEIDTMIVGRGGGSKEELWAFNEEKVARSIYQSKIPVISAVGHETDVTIADFVADRRAETPTAAAQLAVPHIGQLKESVHSGLMGLIDRTETYLQYLEMKVQRNSEEEFLRLLENKVSLCHMKVDRLHELLEAFNPTNIMAKGYVALVGEDNGLIDSVNKLKKDQKIWAKFKDGRALLSVEELHRGK
ncbi:MAG: exodeoxyribonuclease VII large subunit, partial [Anaerovorax sp.]